QRPPAAGAGRGASGSRVSLHGAAPRALRTGVEGVEQDRAAGGDDQGERHGMHSRQSQPSLWGGSVSRLSPALSPASAATWILAPTRRESGISGGSVREIPSRRPPHPPRVFCI